MVVSGLGRVGQLERLFTQPSSLRLPLSRPSSSQLLTRQKLQRHAAIVAVFKTRTKAPAPAKSKAAKPGRSKLRSRVEDGIFGTSGDIGFTK